MQQALSSVGLMLILCSIYAFSKSTPFPSVYTLVPTVGAALIILFATSNTIVGAFLGSGTLVGIGVISYSAYLWHQPLFAFTRHVLFSSEPSPVLLLGLSPFALLFAYFSWRFVEQPFRTNIRTSSKTTLLIAGFFTAVFIIIGVVGHISHGFIGRYTSQEQELLLSTEQTNVNKIMNAHGLNKCFLLQGTLADLYDEKCLNTSSRNPRVVIFGDSHAAHLSSGVRYHFGRAGFGVDQWTMPGCSTFFLPDSKDIPCRKMFDEFILKVIPTLTSSDIIIISANWSLAPTIISDAKFVEALENGFQRLYITSAKIIVVGPSPAFSKAPQSIVVRQKISVQETIYLQEGNKLVHLNALVEGVSSKFDQIYISPLRGMCKNDNIRMCIVKKDGLFLYLDHGHLSEFGSVYLIGEMWDQLIKEKYLSKY